MPPRSLRTSKAVTRVLPEAAQVAFLVDAAHLMSVKAPAMAAYLGRRALEVSADIRAVTLVTDKLPPPPFPMHGLLNLTSNSRQCPSWRAMVQQACSVPAQVSQTKKVPLPKGAAQKLCRRCGAVQQLSDPQR